MEINKMNAKGITLIALVVTIVVLLILAAVSISMLAGENGIIRQAIKAKEENEITSIKEEAELVKSNMFIGDYAKAQRVPETAQRKNLVKALNENFEGSTSSGNVITTSNNKYDIIVKNDLEIIVVKHGENSLKDGELEILYYYDESDAEDGVSVEMSVMIGGIETYEEFAKKILEGKTLPEKETMFVESDKYWNGFTEETKDITDFAEYVKTVLGGDESAPKTLAEFKEWINEGQPDNEFETVDDLLIFWGYVKPEEYFGKTYIQHAQEILDSITQTGDARIAILEQYYIEAWNYWEFGEQKYTDWTSLMTYWEEQGWTTFGNLQELAVDDYGYSSIEEFLLYDDCWIKPQEYEEYQEQLNNPRMVEIQCLNGETRNVIAGEYTGFWITENGSYTFTATGPNGETGEVTIDINNIVGRAPTINSVLAERTSEGLKITVNATNAGSYQFKIDEGAYSTSQTSNIYNYNINYGEAKTTSSTTDPYIPRGFVHTEGTVDTGYVVSDLPKDYTLTVKAINSSGKNSTTVTKLITGSEFVWVPVDNDDSTVYPSLTRGVTGEGLSSSYTEDLGSSADSKSVQYFIDSVNTNGGFYIARYEAGMPGNISKDKPILSLNDTSRNITAVPVARESVMPWNCIDWNNAKASSELMYSLSTDGIQSQLINSYAWDTVLNWVIASGEKTQAEVITDSTNWGNYYGSSYTFSGMYMPWTLNENGPWSSDTSIRSGNNITKQANDSIAYILETGALKQRNSVKNIWGLAGNMEEWTTEKYSSYRILRGSYYCTTNSSYQRASNRYDHSVPYANYETGFRVVLCK